MRDRGEVGGDLQVLDPDTGEPFVDEVDQDVTPRGRRRRSLRSVALVLAALSVVSGLGAIYAGSGIASLRRIERVWRQAMAVDAARGEADRTIFATMGAFGDAEDEGVRDPIVTVGDEEVRRLLGFEDELGATTIVDGGVSGLRSEMAKALEFRRRQLTAGRGRIGDSPLRRVETQLGEQLHRWRLTPAPAAPPAELATLPSALAQLQRFVDRPTQTVLVGTRGTTLLAIDLDADQVQEAPLPGPAVAVVALPKVVVTVVGGAATAWQLPALEPLPWRLPATRAVAAVETGTVWLQAGGSVTRVDTDGRVLAGPVTLPAGRELLGATGAGLVVGSGRTVTADRGVIHTLDLFDPSGRAPGRSLAAAGRFLGSSPSLVLWAGPATRLPGSTESPPDGDVVNVLRPGAPPDRLAAGADRETLDPPTDAGPAAVNWDESIIAFPSGPLRGTVATVLVSRRTLLNGLEGPSADLDGGVTWSASGRLLFWLTPEGRPVIYDFDGPGGGQARLVRVALTGLERLVATGPGSRP